jgi:hypothetical protein
MGSVHHQATTLYQSCSLEPPSHAYSPGLECYTGTKDQDARQQLCLKERASYRITRRPVELEIEKQIANSLEEGAMWQVKWLVSWLENR